MAKPGPSRGPTEEQKRKAWRKGIEKDTENIDVDRALDVVHTVKRKEKQAQKAAEEGKAECIKDRAWAKGRAKERKGSFEKRKEELKSRVQARCGADVQTAKGGASGAKAALEQAKAKLRAARAEVAKAQAACRTERRDATLELTSRHQTMQKLNREDLETARSTCANAADAGRKHKQAKTETGQAKQKVSEARADRTRSKKVRNNPYVKKAKATGGERRAEALSKAEHNIAPELLPLWHREKSRFRGSPDAMAEQFMEYVQEHPGLVLEAQQEAAGLADTGKFERKLEQEQRAFYESRQAEQEGESEDEIEGDAVEPEEGDTSFDPEEFEEPAKSARKSGPKLSAKARTVNMFSNADLYSSFQLVRPEAPEAAPRKAPGPDLYSARMF